MARLRPKQLSSVQATLRNKLTRTSQSTRRILTEGAEDIKELAEQLVREDSGQLRKSISIEKQRDSRNRLSFVVYVDTSTRAAYRLANGTLRYRDFTVARYASAMNTGGFKWGARSKLKNRAYGGFTGVERDRGRYVGDHFIVRAKSFYEPMIIRRMKIAIDEAL